MITEIVATLGVILTLTLNDQSQNLMVLHMTLVYWASYLHLCASVTKQYNLVLAKGVISG